MSNRKKRSWFPYILGGVVVVGGAMYALGGGKQDEKIKVVVEAAAKRELIETVSASGKVFPEVEVEITSVVSGTLVEITVKEGDFVKAGQLLARVDPDAIASIVERTEAAANTARAQLESVRAQKEQLEAQFKNTKASYQRNKQLFEQGVISKADMDAAQAAYETALANIATSEKNILAAQFTVKSSEASVKEQRKSLSQTSIYAPIDGIVSKLNKKKGEQVVGTAQMAGTTILKIADLNSVEVRVDVNERDILEVSLHDTASIELDAYPNRKFSGIVTQIASSASNASTTTLTSDQVTNFEVRIRLNPASYQELQRPDGKSPFRSGMSASAEIRTNVLANVMTVPVGAVTARAHEDTVKHKHSEFQEYVFMQQGDSVILQAVGVGAQDDTYMEITSGLNGGEMVVKAPYDAIAKKLKMGSKVQVVTEDELYSKNNETDAAATK